MILILLFAVYLGMFGLPKCIQFTKFIRDYIKYNCIDRIKEIKKNRHNRNELSETSIKCIKEHLLSHKHIFPCSDSIELLHDNDGDESLKYNMYMDILSNYTNYMDWGPKQLGDVLTILDMLNTKSHASRYLMRTRRCYDILLKDYIIYLYDDVYNNIDGEKYNNEQIRYIRSLVLNLSETNKEERKKRNI